MEQGVVAVLAELIRRRQLVDVDPGEIPAVRLRDRAELLRGLRQGHVEAALALLHALDEVLEGERGLAHAWIALDQVHAVWWQTTAQHIVEPADPGAYPRR